MHRKLKALLSYSTKVGVRLLILVTLLSLGTWSKTAASADGPHTIHLPTVLNNYSFAKVLLGLYPTGWTGFQSTIDQEVTALGNWSGKQISITGNFIYIAPTNYDSAVTQPLTMIYQNGYTPFVNIMPQRQADGGWYTAAEIANGSADHDLTLWAQAFKVYTNGGKRMAYLAPMPEMNGPWVKYYFANPELFKQAYWRVQKVFADAGVPRSSIQWVFAPNAASMPENNFELYYPGDETVDVVGFSAYNFATCYSSTGQWLSLNDVSKSYAQRMQVMAPSKPIFLTQFATGSSKLGAWNDTSKNTWLRNGYAFLLTVPGLRAVIYFNIDDLDSSGKMICDMAMFRSWNSTFPKTYQGYKDAVQSSGFIYVSPDQLKANPLRP